MKGKKTTPNHLVLIRPLNFSFNEQTSESNVFQNKPSLLFSEPEDAMDEFKSVVRTLLEHDISFTVFNEIETPIIKPDAIFSNNWIVYMPNGPAYTMSMLTENRKAEVNHSLIMGQYDTTFENSDMPLEGTGSMVIDHENKKIYANLSSRTNYTTLSNFASKINYKLITFNSSDSEDNEIYHTNVILSIGEKWAVICKDVIVDYENIISSLESDGKEIILITEDEMKKFCANIFEVKDINNNLNILMSTTAYNSFNYNNKLKILGKYANVVCAPIHTIENIGGGSLRCMLTGVFL
jgi:hypothetical protein